MKTIISMVSTLALLLLLFIVPVKATNSLANPEGIENMKAIGIDNAVIRTLTAEQTCSVSPDLLVKLKRAGVDDETLIQVILADRYKKPKPVNFSTREIDLLRRAGCPDEVIATLQGVTSPAPFVDGDKREGVVYRTDGLRDPEDRRCNDTPNDFYINIEKVEGN
jgi:hypothetical protein